MTSPVNVGQVSVEVVASARALAKSLKKEVESAFKDLDVSKSIQDAVGNTAVKVKADLDTTGFGEKLKAETDLAARRAKTKVKVGVDVDKKGSSVLAGIGGLIKGFGKGLPNFGGVAANISELGGALQKAAGSSAQLGGSLTGAFVSATGPIGLVIGLLTTAAAAMAALGTAAILVVPALTAVAGAAAAIPAALVGAGAAFGTLALGFRGIGAAFKPKTGGGGGGGEDAASRARRIAAAERGVDAARRGIAAATRALQSAERGLADAEQNVADALKRAAQAQLAVNKARVEAKEDIDDLNRSLRGAKLSEEDATLGVQEAIRALNEAKLTGNIPDIQRADLAYRQALQTLDEAKDTTEDLQLATDDANKKGVEGSDKVQSALQDQQDALRAVKDAQNGVLDAQNAVLSANDGLKSSYDSLTSAQDSLAEAQKRSAAGAAAAAAKLIPLAPAARRFVDAVKALKPAFEDLRLDVQQRLFDGLDKTVTRLGKVGIPALKITLGSFADTFNAFFRNLGASITTPKFIHDLQVGAEGARQGLASIGDAVTTSLVPAFGALSRAAGPFLAQLGQEIADIVTQFSNWVLEGEKTGGLTSFFDKASAALHDIFTTGRLVTSIVGHLLQAIIGPGATAKKSPIDSFNDALQQVNDYLANPANQQKIHDFITGIADSLVTFGRAVDKIDGWLDRVFPADGKDRASSLGADIGSALVAGLLAGVAAAMKASATFFIDNLLIGPVIGLVKKGFGINSPSTVMAAIGVQLIQGLLVGLANGLRSLLSTVAQIPGLLVRSLGNTGGLLVGSGRNFAIGLANGIVSQYGTVSSRAAGLRTVVSNALPGAGSWLYNHGRAIIAGLINGISSALGTLGSFLGSVGSFIQAHKGPIERDRLLLVGAGQAIMDGLITGISDKKAALAAELSDVTRLVSDTSLTADLGSVAGSLERSAVLQAQWAPGATGDPVLDAFRKLIKFGYSGNVQAALGSS